MHFQEIPENGADTVHLSFVHGPAISAGIDLRYMWSKVWQFLGHDWTARWEANPAPEEHIGTIHLTHSMRIFGKRIPPIDLTVTGRQVNFALVLALVRIISCILSVSSL
jgi:hypothetical protein